MKKTDENDKLRAGTLGTDPFADAPAMPKVGQAGKKEEAVRRIQQWDLLTRKLQVGVFIRTGTMDAEAGKATEDLRERLEELRDALLADDLAKAKELLAPVEEAYRKCRDCYQPPQTKSASGGS